MKKDIVYWTTKDNKKIDIDEMSISHLRNCLKMCVRKGIDVSFSKQEIDSLINKSSYEQMNEENMWK